MSGTDNQDRPTLMQCQPDLCFERMFYTCAVIKRGTPDDSERMFARIQAEESRPIDDPAPIRDFPKYGRPLVYVSGIYGKAVGWTHTYGLIEWLDSSGKYHMGWAHSSSIKRVTPEEWKGASGL
ncbi:hypothetical protein [Pseudarthrobacter sp. ATCC 49987]|uniref:hypothetical protein n=1 Tax=Pseudarthrobacter sp. ATCC 49987 TaxID=2698204 RepID=UPI00136EE0F5|nr:hypothetical protein [Pseudarthrobacter sp. ATCC 49987]